MTGGLGGPARLPQSSLAFITGLTAEARLLAGLPCITRAGGGTPAGAAGQAEAAIRAGAKALVSFGLAGGLDPALEAGTILRPATVLWRKASFPTDADLTAALGGVTYGKLLAAEATIVSAREKQAAYAATGAAAVDLESGAVAEIAHRHGVPFAVLRAICDTASENLPPAALEALDPAGKIKFLRLAQSLLRQPGQIQALLALAAHANTARKNLGREVARIAARGALLSWL
jgi:adenosylhomocysteine nucleosidase